jgi:acetylcholinesterase/carboxylesterase 2
MIASLALYALLPLLAAAAPAVGTTPPPNPTVTIASGVIIGTATTVSNQPTVTGYANAYLGVPFASPPVRFAPPTPPQPYTTLQAQTLPPACLQEFFSGAVGERTRAYFNNPGLPPPAESEDCLYLNVFAPQDASPTNLKSVLFWIYGGNLAFGTASLAYYNGSSLAVNEDVVVVAINYRTNIFGFSNSPEIPVNSQNSGFLDQRFALQWVS